MQPNGGRIVFNVQIKEPGNRASAGGVKESFQGSAPEPEAFGVVAKLRARAAQEAGAVPREEPGGQIQLNPGLGKFSARKGLEPFTARHLFRPFPTERLPGRVAGCGQHPSAGFSKEPRPRGAAFGRRGASEQAIERSLAALGHPDAPPFAPVFFPLDGTRIASAQEVRPGQIVGLAGRAARPGKEFLIGHPMRRLPAARFPRPARLVPFREVFQNGRAAAKWGGHFSKRESIFTVLWIMGANQIRHKLAIKHGGAGLLWRLIRHNVPAMPSRRGTGGLPRCRGRCSRRRCGP